MTTAQQLACPSVALSIAGSDSGGGAGIQADIKAFRACQVHGATAITAITAQNTVGVTALCPLPTDIVAAQIDAVFSDFRIAAVKTGMLASAAIIDVVVDRLAAWGATNIVVDPVMVATSGHALLDPEAVATLTRRLLPLALVVTPNLAEAQALSGIPIHDEPDMTAAAEAIAAFGAQCVLVKGGHLAGEAADILWDSRERLVRRFAGDRITGGETHGTGCALSAAIAAGLAKGLRLVEAISAAKTLVANGIRRALAVGHGAPVVNLLP